jgi:hypothetical protein
MRIILVMLSVALLLSCKRIGDENSTTIKTNNFFGISSSITSYDIGSKATFVGRWFSDQHSGLTGMSTIRQGSSFISKVSGATKLIAKIAVPVNQNYAPILAVYINDSNLPMYVKAGIDGKKGGGNGGQIILVDLVTGLSTDKIYTFTIFIAGLDIVHTKWITGSGLNIVDLAVDAGSVISVLDKRPKALFIGDSITEGLECITSNKYEVLPKDSCGDRTYSILTARKFGLAPIANGFGGSGLIKAVGSLPPTLINYANFKGERLIDLENEKINFVFINIGTNDSEPGYIDNMTFLLNTILRYKPKRVFIIRPFASDVKGFTNHVPEIQTAISIINDPRVVFIDTTGWTLPTDFYGAHPTLAGHIKIARRLTNFIELGCYMEDNYDFKNFFMSFYKTIQTTHLFNFCGQSI